MPRFIKDEKTGKNLLAKKATTEEFNKIEKIKTENPERYEKILSNFYYRAKMFSYKELKKEKFEEVIDFLIKHYMIRYYGEGLHLSCSQKLNGL